MNSFILWLCLLTVFTGAIKTLGLLLGFMSFMFRHCFRCKQNLLKRYGGKGTWAVVTGASDGIGAEFCRQLAEDGFNICLISRTQEKLVSVESELKRIAPGIETMVIQADFSNNSNLGYYG